jgi:hypothetical protein
LSEAAVSIPYVEWTFPLDFVDDSDRPHSRVRSAGRSCQFTLDNPFRSHTTRPSRTVSFAAQKKGIFFDIGHGGGSFAWQTAVQRSRSVIIPTLFQPICT